MVDFSLIIPVFNEREKIAVDIAAAASYFTEKNMHAEIIIADDGSSDDTCEIASAVPLPEPLELSIIRAKKHRGKGYALRKGFTRSRGKYVMFADSGNTVPWHTIERGLALITSGKCDIAHGSRFLPQSVILTNRSWKRKMISSVFRFGMRWSLAVPADLSDSQCGFKIFRGEVARELFARAKLNGFLIDIEIILLALKAGYLIREFPLQWRCDPDSRLSLPANFFSIFKEWRQLRSEIAP